MLPTTVTAAGGSVSIPAKGDLVQQRLQRERVVALLQLGQSIRVETIQDGLQRAHPGDVGGAFGGRIFADGKGVEVDGAAVVVSAQCGQEFQRLSGVDASDQ
jgi:hypothetical protein